MVFAAGLPIRIFGEGAGKVSVELDGAAGETVSAGGKWVLEPPPHGFGGPYSVKIDLDGEKKELSDVYFGDVFLLAGQSNIEFKLKESSLPRDKYKANDKLRYFATQRPDLSGAEVYHPEDGWFTCTDVTAPDFSAIGYHVAEKVNEKTGHAVGLVACYQGASVIESWLPERENERKEFYLPDEKKHLDHFYPEFEVFNGNSSLYHSIFEKLVPFSFSAVIWYQGESNRTVHEAVIYPLQLNALVLSWREDLKDEDLPFYVIQIADLDELDHDGWHAIQAAQEKGVEMTPGATLIVSRDVCETNSIHPATKNILSYRIADEYLKNNG